MTKEHYRGRAHVKPGNCLDGRTVWLRRRRVDCESAIHAAVEITLDRVRTKYDVFFPSSHLLRFRLREEARQVTHLLGHPVLFTKIWQRSTPGNNTSCSEPPLRAPRACRHIHYRAMT